MHEVRRKHAAAGALAAAFTTAVVILAWLAASAGADPPSGPYELDFVQTAMGGASAKSGSYSLESTVKAARCTALTQTQGVYSIENVLAVTIYASNGSAAASPTGLSLSWTAAAMPPGAQGFDVHRSATGYAGSYQRINGAPLAGTTYEDGDLPAGDYFYIVYLIDAGGQPIQWTASFKGTSETPLEASGAKLWMVYE